MILHLWTFKTPIFTELKIQKCKINYDGSLLTNRLSIIWRVYVCARRSQMDDNIYVKHLNTLLDNI